MRFTLNINGCAAQKTLFSQILCQYLLKEMIIKTVCISADGYHYDNKTLVKKGIRADKGLPFTFSVSCECIDDLHKIHSFL